MSRMAEASTILRTCAVAAAFIPGVDCIFAFHSREQQGANTCLQIQGLVGIAARQTCKNRKRTLL